MALADGYIQTALGGSHNDTDLFSCCHCLWGHATPVVSVALDSNMDVVVSGSEMGLVCIHTLRRGAFIRSFHPPAVATTTTTTATTTATTTSNTTAGSVHKIAIGTEGGLIVLQMKDMGLHTYTVNAVRLCTVHASELLHDMLFCAMDEILVTGGDRLEKR